MAKGILGESEISRLAEEFGCKVVAQSMWGQVKSLRNVGPAREIGKEILDATRRQVKDIAACLAVVTRKDRQLSDGASLAPILSGQEVAHHSIPGTLGE